MYQVALFYSSSFENINGKTENLANLTWNACYWEYFISYWESYVAGYALDSVERNLVLSIFIYHVDFDFDLYLQDLYKAATVFEIAWKNRCY